MRFGGVEIDAVALFEDDGLSGNVKLHLAFEYHVKLLAWMRVLINHMSLGLWLDGDNEHVGLMVDETAH